jgi:tetratricopeptide (TPR) repeat protein
VRNVSLYLKSSPWTLNIAMLLSLTLGAEAVCAQSVDEYIRQGAQFTREHRLTEAIELLQRALQQHPDEPLLLIRLGSLLVHSGQLTQGELLLQKALDVQPQDPEILRNMAEARLRQGRISSAVTLLRQSLRQKSEDEALNHDLAFALFLENDREGALQHARRAVQLNPFDAKHRRLYALLLDIKGQKEQSYYQVKIAQQLAPRDPRLLFELSEKQRLAGRLDQALDSLRMASELDPENPLYHSELSRLCERLNRKALALEEGDKARTLYQAFEAYIQALTLKTGGRRAEAARLLEPVVERHPEFVTGIMLLAELYQKMGQEKRALDLYFRVLERDPMQAAAREEAAWIQVQQGALEPAAELLAKSPQGSPNQALVKAYRQQEHQDYAGALQQLRSLESDNPLNPGLLQLISFCLGTLGEREEALHYLTKAAKLSPGHPEIQLQARDIEFQVKFDNAMQLFNRKDWKAALDSLTDLIDQGEPQASYFLYAAYCRQQLGDLRQAVNDYQAGLRLDPEASWARKNLAVSLYLLSRYEESAKQWERILTKSRAPEEYLQLGLCYVHLSRHREAENAFQTALGEGKETPELLYNLGVTRLRNGKQDDAWPLIRRSASAGYGPAVLLSKQVGRKGSN